MIRNNQNRRRRGGNNNGPRPQQMNGGNNYGNRLDNRQRGNASQLLEKYRALARDAQQAGDRVTAEYYLQYADHYYRVLGDYRDKQPDNRARRDNFDDDSAGYAGGNDEAEGDEEDDDGDRNEARNDVRSDARNDDRGRGEDRGRTDARGDERGRTEARGEDRGDDRGNWRDERPSGNRDRGFREGNREPRRDGEGNRDGNREPRREGGNRERGQWNGDRQRDAGADAGRNDTNRAEAGRNADSPRGDRGSERNDRAERQANVAPPAFATSVDEGPIPGLPGPATLRLNRSPASDTALPRAERAPRAPRREPEIATEAVAEPAVNFAEAETEAAAPRRRGRPRKLVDEATVEG